MHPFDLIHKSWEPIIRSNLYLLEELNTDILPNCKYYPAKENIFRAFNVPVNKIQVVILGIDPYFTPDTATGRAFAVGPDTDITPHLKNILKEISDEGVLTHPQIESWLILEHWEKQGVMLLNTALTVEAGMEGSHLKYWRKFIKNTIKYISHATPCIWLLWGTQDFIPCIKGKTMNVIGYDRDTILSIPKDPIMNYILTAPSPNREGFFGCNHFYFTNKILTGNKKFPIKW